MFLILYLLSLSQLIDPQSCTIYQTVSLGNNLDPILAISPGIIHLTLAYGTSPTSQTAKQFDLYNASANTTVTLSVPAGGLSLVELEEFQPTNNEVNNVYVLGAGAGGGGMVGVDNFGTVGYSWGVGSGVVGTCFGESSEILYQLVSAGGICSLRVVNITSQTFTDEQNLTATCLAVSYSNSRIYTTSSSSNTLTLSIYTTLSPSPKPQPLTSKIFPLPVPQPSQPPILRSCPRYYSLSILDTVYTYSSTDDTNLCNLTVNGTVYDFRVTDRWIFVSFGSTVGQYDVGSCRGFGSFGVTGPVKIRTHQPSVYSFYTRIFLLAPGAMTVLMLNVEDRYICAGGCTSCINLYELDSGGQCFYSGNPSPPPPAPPVLPSAPITPIAIINPACFMNGQFYCQQFCNYKCNSCSNSSETCQICSPKRNMKENSQCATSVMTVLATTALNTLNTFRPSSIQFAFSLLDNLENYQYHAINYTGVFSDVLQEINYVENLKWSLISVDYVLDWTQRPYFASLPYNAFTNQKFLQVERQSALLFETAKAYYSVYVPLVCVVFLMLNRLFFLTSRFRASQLLRPFSFWLQLLVLISISDSSRLGLLSLNYLQMIFSYSTWLRLTHAIALLFIGFFLLATLALFPFSAYFYGPLCKYFLFNLFRVNCSFIYAFLRYSLRPLVETALHVLLFRNPQCQLLSLISLEILFLLLTLAWELLFQLFRNKCLLLCDVLLSFQTILILCINYSKYFVFPDDEDIKAIFQDSLTIILIMATAILVLSFLQPTLSMLIFLIYNRNPKRSQNQLTIVQYQSRKFQQASKQMPTAAEGANDERFSTINHMIIKSECLKSKKQIHVKITDENLENNIVKHRTKKSVQERKRNYGRK